MRHEQSAPLSGYRLAEAEYFKRIGRHNKEGKTMKIKYSSLIVLCLLLSPSTTFADSPNGRGHHKHWNERPYYENSVPVKNNGPFTSHSYGWRYPGQGESQGAYGWRNPARGEHDFRPNRYGADSSRDIWDGIRSGKLSKREVEDLRRDEQNIRREDRLSADGYLSQREREDLQKDRHAFSKDLDHELNDGEYRRTGHDW
jgi:hypothetical protein